MKRISVSNDELKTFRNGSVELGKLIEKLEGGELEKIVLAKHGHMRAVLISLDTWLEMQDA